MFKFVVIIATKDRAFEIERLLKSIQIQEIHPQDIIIVDAGVLPNTSSDADIKHFSPLTIKRIKAHRACLPAQRNQGLAMVSPDVEYVCFLDDDIVLDKEAFSKMASFWENASEDTGGAVFNIMNEKKPTSGVILKKIFCTGSFNRGVVLPSGYNTLMCPASRNIQVQWLFGGATVWRRKIFDQFLFDDWFESTGLCEDLDFSYQVAKKFKLFVVADAKVDHLTGTVGRRRNVWFGRSQIKNRYHFVTKNKELSKALCLWAGIGQFLENIALGVLLFSGHYFLRAWGNMVGFFELGFL